MREIEIKQGKEIVAICYSVESVIDEITRIFKETGVSTYAHLGTVHTSR